MEWKLQNDRPVTDYSHFGCPKCGAKHKFGHKKEWIDCWRCWYTFNPQRDSRRYNEFLINNLSVEDMEAAIERIHGKPKKHQKPHTKKKETFCCKIINYLKSL